MFRRLHIQMTIFATLITSAILVLMTLACLTIAENGTRQNVYTSFKNNVSSCISHLETQTVISHSWILKAEQSYGIEMEIKDNGKSLYFRTLVPSIENQAAFKEAAQASIDLSGIDLTNPGSVSVLTKSTVFQMKDYYAATALIPKNGGALSVILLYPLDGLTRQLVSQRIAFAVSVLLAAFALGIFSWFFTKKMILPLEESHRKQTEFIAAASHELRSPLAVILSGISALKTAEPAERPRFLSVITEEGTRMSRLVNDMLSLANADNQSWSMYPETCELDTLVLDTYEKYESMMQQRLLHFSIGLPDTILPPCTCDSSRISQVLGILLDNAMSYVPADGSICLSLKETDTAFLISVSDNGPGIPDEKKRSIFERFYRADAARKDKQHFGLGLCIAREIITLHNGELTVSDAPGGGAVFTISLPK